MVNFTGQNRRTEGAAFDHIEHRDFKADAACRFLVADHLVIEVEIFTGVRDRCPVADQELFISRGAGCVAVQFVNVLLFENRVLRKVIIQLIFQFLAFLLFVFFRLLAFDLAFDFFQLAFQRRQTVFGKDVLFHLFRCGFVNGSVFAFDLDSIKHLVHTGLGDHNRVQRSVLIAETVSNAESNDRSAGRDLVDFQCLRVCIDIIVQQVTVVKHILNGQLVLDD